MIWIFSFALTLCLALCVLCVVYPDLLAPFLVDHWKKYFTYWRN